TGLGFWKGAKSALTKLCKDDLAIRRKLLDLFPSIETKGWLLLLEHWGVLAALYHDDAPQEARTALGTAEWFHQLLAQEIRASNEIHTNSAGTVALLIRAKGRLQEEGVELKAHAGRWAGMNIDVVETCLAQDIPLELGEEKLSRLIWWARNAAIDPLFISKHPVLRERFIDALHSDAYWAKGFAPLLEGRPGLTDMISAWLETLLDRSNTRLGLPGTFEVLKKLAYVPKEMWEVFPQSAARLWTLSFGKALATTLNIGVLDEFGWPALEAVLDKHFPQGGVQLITPFPYVVLYSATKAVVMGPGEEVLLEHDIQTPKGKDIYQALYTQGDLLLSFHHWYSDMVAYWVSNPKKLSKWEGHGRDAVVIGDGRVLYEGAPLSPGDTRTRASRGATSSDGERIWIQSEDDQIFRRYDPETNTLGEQERPPFVEPSEEHAFANGWVLPSPEPAAGSPVQIKDGLVGLRWTTKTEIGQAQTYGTDTAGRSFSYAGDNTPRALLSFPGSDEPRSLASHSRDFHLRDAQGTMGSDDYLGFRAGGAFFHQLPMMVRFAPRDVEGSKAMRAFDAKQAEALITAANAGPFTAEKHRDFEPAPEVIAAIEKHLPEVSHPKLKKAIAGVLGAVTGQQKRLEKLLDKLPKELREGAEAGSSDTGYRLPKRKSGHKELAMGLAGLVTLKREDNTIFSEAKEVAGFFGRGDAQEGHLRTAPGAGFWEGLIGNGAAVAYRMLLPKVKKDDRPVLRQLLEYLAKLGFSGPEVAQRYRLGPVPFDTWDRTVEYGNPELSSKDGNDYFCSKARENLVLLEHARSGGFEHIDEKDNILGSGWGSKEQVAELWALFEERGAIPLKQAILLFAEKTGLTLTEATLYATAEWQSDTYGWVKTREFDWAGRRFWTGNNWDRDMPRIRFAAAIFEGGPLEDLWDAEKLAERIAAHFLANNPKQRVIADESVLSEIQYAVSPDELLSVFRDVAHGDVNPGKDQQRFFKGCYYKVLGPGADHPDPYVKTLLYGFFQTKVGDPFFGGIAQAWERVREWMRHPHYMVPVMDYWGDHTEEPLKSLRERFSGKPDITMEPHKTEQGPVGDSGVCTTDNGRTTCIYATTEAILNGHALLDGLPDTTPKIAEVRFIFSEHVDAFIARSQSSPVDKDAYEADPRHSAPQAISGVMKLHKLSKDAAALYLQLATLFNPTDAMVCRFNGWNKKQLGTAGKELVEKKLVIEAKRAKAGRSLFIPSAWITKAQPKPFESWKDGHLSLLNDDGSGKERPFRYFYELWPPHILYARVWERIQAGEGPGFEEPPR
ncbi:MAG: hypothetical protein JRH20_23910, partial [Deltaproteobacteria bacterium]|nr:hypothetical protein [Deltaproteobacteria bacterium]